MANMVENYIRYLAPNRAPRLMARTRVAPNKVRLA